MTLHRADADDELLAKELRDRFGDDLRAVARRRRADGDVRYLGPRQQGEGPVDPGAVVEDLVGPPGPDLPTAGASPTTRSGQFVVRDGTLLVRLPLDAADDLLVGLDAGRGAAVALVARAAAKHG